MPRLIKKIALITGAPHDPEHATLADWRAVLATNLDGVFLGCKHSLRAMRRGTRSGALINIASRSGVVGIPAAAAYAASKAAVCNHTRSVVLYCAASACPRKWPRWRCCWQATSAPT
jgi:3(or 17)beta-hydroxysteroid dehydrogenase